MSKPELEARESDPWEIDPNCPGWQAAIIRLARPALLWALGIGVMAIGTAIVGAVEAFVPGAGQRMATSMALLLRAYPEPLYWLVGFLFAGQAGVSLLRAWKGK